MEEKRKTGSAGTLPGGDGVKGQDIKTPDAISIADLAAKVNGICENLRAYAAACRYALGGGNDYAALPMRAEDAACFDAAADLLEGLLTEETSQKRQARSKKEKGPIGEFRTYAEELQCPKLGEALAAFEEMRDRKKKPLTAYARHLALCKLKALSGDPEVQAQIVIQSIENSWSGFFPLHRDGRAAGFPAATGPQSSFETDDFFAAALAAGQRRQP